MGSLQVEGMTASLLTQLNLLLSFLRGNVIINGRNCVISMTSEICDGMSVPCAHGEAGV